MPQATVKWLQGVQFVGIDSTQHAVVLSPPNAQSIGVKPSDMLLVALAACSAVDVVEILEKKRLTLTSLEIRVTAEQEPEAPWTFRKFHLHYQLQGADLTSAGVEQAIRLSQEKYCSVAATLRSAATITWDYQLGA